MTEAQQAVLNGMPLLPRAFEMDDGTVVAFVFVRSQGEHGTPPDEIAFQKIVVNSEGSVLACESTTYHRDPKLGSRRTPS